MKMPLVERHFLLIVPTRSKGMQQGTLCVPKPTQSVERVIPTQSMGTINSTVPTGSGYARLLLTTSYTSLDSDPDARIRSSSAFISA